MGRSNEDPGVPMSKSKKEMGNPPQGASLGRKAVKVLSGTNEIAKKKGGGKPWRKKTKKTEGGGRGREDLRKNLQEKGEVEKKALDGAKGIGTLS